MRTVPYFNYPHLFTHQEKELTEVFLEVSRRGAFILQKELAEFEQKLASYIGVKHALGVGNATDALQIGLLAGGIRPGDEVIFCSHTMVATASAVHAIGGVAVPVEAGADHLMDPDAIEGAITARTRAIMPTQLNGRTCDMDAIQAVAKKHGLLVFEDAAQALGSRWKGKGAGSFGVASCISFYPAKVLGCLGDGGAVLTNDDAVLEELKVLRDHGRNHEGDVVRWGFNTRLDNLQAAILNAQFKGYDGVVARRRQIAQMYQDGLGGLKQLVLPPSPGSDANHFDIYQNYEIEAERRDELKQWLKDNGVGTLVQWGGKAVHQFRKLGFTQSLPFTENLFRRMLMLPINMSITDEEVQYVIDQVAAFYRR